MQDNNTQKVVLIGCEDYSEHRIASAIERIFEELGGMEKFVKRGDSVLLKPNFIVPCSRRQAAQTDPAIIIEVARLLKDFGAKPFVADSTAWGSVFECVKKLKLDKPLKKLSVPVKQLNKPKTCYLGPGKIKIPISSVALDADVIINLPKFKTHQQLVATFAVKNMFGCVAGKRKAYLHFSKGKIEKEFCEMLIEIYKFLSPALTIIDGVIAMDGPGPIRGRARPLGWIIAGAEPIACEIICAKLVNFNADELPIVKAAKQINFGCSNPEKIIILGDGFPQSTCLDFEPAKLIPIRFSLLRVCRSTAKQIYLLLKQLLKKIRTLLRNNFLLF